VGTPRGVGNQVSCEFNLLYRFHSGVSKRDDAWTKAFFGKIFPGQDPATIGVPQLLQGLKVFENSIPKEPEKRTFGGLKRTGADGTGAFNDDDLVQILKESIEDPAGECVSVWLWGDIGLLGSTEGIDVKEKKQVPLERILFLRSSSRLRFSESFKRGNGKLPP